MVENSNGFLGNPKTIEEYHGLVPIVPGRGIPQWFWDSLKSRCTFPPPAILCEEKSPAKRHSEGAAATEESQHTTRHSERSEESRQTSFKGSGCDRSIHNKTRRCFATLNMTYSGVDLLRRRGKPRLYSPCMQLIEHRRRRSGRGKPRLYNTCMQLMKHLCNRSGPPPPYWVLCSYCPHPSC